MRGELASRRRRPFRERCGSHRGERDVQARHRRHGVVEPDERWCSRSKSLSPRSCRRCPWSRGRSGREEQEDGLGAEVREEAGRSGAPRRPGSAAEEKQRPSDRQRDVEDRVAALSRAAGAGSGGRRAAPRLDVDAEPLLELDDARGVASPGASTAAERRACARASRRRTPGAPVRSAPAEAVPPPSEPMGLARAPLV